jgi:hypothetical protein
MKIRLAVVSPENLPRARALIQTLRKASNSGDMDGMDEVTEKLLAMVDEAHSTVITEAEWREWLSDIRTENPTFQSDYLVSGEIFPLYFPHATAGTMVLQLPFDEREGTDV